MTGVRKPESLSAWQWRSMCSLCQPQQEEESLGVIQKVQNQCRKRMLIFCSTSTLSIAWKEPADIFELVAIWIWELYWHGHQNKVFQFWKTVQTFLISFKLASWVDNCIIKIIRAGSFQNKRETTRIEYSGKKVPHDSSIQFYKQHYQTETDLYKLLKWDLVVSVCVCLTDCPVRDAAQLKQTQQ